MELKFRYADWDTWSGKNWGEKIVEETIKEKSRMDKVAREALERCIKEKWEPLASGECEFEVEPRCALCDEYNHVKTNYTCTGCPVFERVKINGCEGTPYREWDRVIDKGFMANVNSYKAVTLAKKELEFLKSLREPDSKPM